MRHFSVSTNTDYTLAVQDDGSRVIDNLTLNEAMRLRDNLSRALSGAKFVQTLCRRQWVKCVNENYELGTGHALRVSNGVDKSEHYICLHTGKANGHYVQFTVEGYISQLKEPDQHKAREVFAKWLQKGKHE